MSRIEHLARNEWPRTLRSVLGLEHGVGYRLVGRALNSHASYLASGQKKLGAERLYGEGDFLVVAGSASQRMQVVLVDERYMAHLPRNGERQIDLTPDLERVLGVTDVGEEDAGLKPEWVAWALTDYFNRRRASCWRWRLLKPRPLGFV